MNCGKLLFIYVFYLSFLNTVRVLIECYFLYF